MYVHSSMYTLVCTVTVLAGHSRVCCKQSATCGAASTASSVVFHAYRIVVNHHRHARELASSRESKARAVERPSAGGRPAGQASGFRKLWCRQPHAAHRARRCAHPPSRARNTSKKPSRKSELLTAARASARFAKRISRRWQRRAQSGSSHSSPLSSLTLAYRPDVVLCHLQNPNQGVDMKRGFSHETVAFFELFFVFADAASGPKLAI